jgi:hypothetical protein
LILFGSLLGSLRRLFRCYSEDCSVLFGGHFRFLSSTLAVSVASVDSVVCSILFGGLFGSIRKPIRVYSVACSLPSRRELRQYTVFSSDISRRVLDVSVATESSSTSNTISCSAQRASSACFTPYAKYSTNPGTRDKKYHASLFQFDLDFSFCVY